MRPARKSAPIRELDFNECVGVDVIFLPLPDGTTRPSLNIIDWGTKFQLMIPMDTKKPAATREAYRHWLRLFGAPKKMAIDLGREFKGHFARCAETDGTFVDPAAVEAPHQRGITERHGKTFKFMLMKAMETHSCETVAEWEDLVDVTTMTKNRMYQHNGFSPAQRVLGFNPQMLGGLLSGDGGNRAFPSQTKLGDLSIERSMKMRKAAAQAFVEADASEVLRRAISSGPRPMQEYDIGEMVYFYRMGANKAKKYSSQYWCGPARIVMLDQPSTVWLSYQGGLVKAAPERIRRASLEENLTLSGWIKDIVKKKHDPCTDPKRGYMDLEDHPLPPAENPDPEGELEYAPSEMDDDDKVPPIINVDPQRRYRDKRSQDIEDVLREEMTGDGGFSDLRPELPAPPELPVPAEERGQDQDEQMREAGLKREMEDEGDERPAKRSRAEYLELYHLKVEKLVQARQRKEIRMQELSAKNHKCFMAAINKEITNNTAIGAYTILSQEESARIRQQHADRIMDSRFVFTAKPLEPQEVHDAQEAGLLLDWNSEEPCKAKARHVMKGFSEDGSSTIEATTPQVTREGTLMVTQLVASHKWRIGFLDFTQAFMSGDPIQRTIYAAQPREGIPGLAPGQLIRLEKVCYGLVDGPLAWFQHLQRMLTQDLGYTQSLADPCIYYSHRTYVDEHGKTQKKLGGIIAVATDDLLHGGDEEHLACMEQIQKKYKLGKYQFDNGKFTGKMFSTLDDGSILINQAQYTREKLLEIDLDKHRKRQRYSFCTEKELGMLRASVGALSWLAKESRPDLAGRVALLQQTFPRPRVKDLLECNSITQEARKHPESGVRIMPIDPKNLRIGVATDASWANAKDREGLEKDGEDFWEEQEGFWIRHHRTSRRTLFHPGAVEGPELHGLLPVRRTVCDDGKIIEDLWTKSDSIKAREDSGEWTGKTYFAKQPPGQELPHGEINEMFLKLMNCSSQGGYVMMYYDQELETSKDPRMVSVTSWKSTKLKRKTVNTLSAECQSLITGIGHIHWRRFLLLELLGESLNEEDWEQRLASIPYVSVVDSRSLYDCLNKLVCTYAQIEDKRTAIDAAILKDDLYKTGGHLRWVEGNNMIADSLTKRMSSEFLRNVCNNGLWSLSKSGHQTLLKKHDLLMVTIHTP